MRRRSPLPGPGVRSLELDGFTAFDSVRFEFSPGVNMLLGGHATGKTHVLKAVYAILKSAEAAVQDDPAGPAAGKGFPPPLWARLSRIFRPDGTQVGRLIRAGSGRARLDLGWKGGRLGVDLRSDDSAPLYWRPGVRVPRCLFLPSREALTLYEDFVAAYLHRQLGFDETYYDLCVALARPPLTGAALRAARALLTPLSEVLPRLAVVEKHKRFYVSFGGDGLLESHLVAEGVRKLAGLVRLVMNGALAPGGVLLWDEPAGGLEPRLVEAMAELLAGIAEAGIQVLVATQGTALPRAFAVAMAAHPVSRVPARFFGLTRSAPGAPVELRSGASPGEVEPEETPTPRSRRSSRPRTRSRKEPR